MATTYSQGISGTTVTVPGLTHGLGSEDLVFAVYDTSNPRVWVDPGYATVDASTFELILGFFPSFSGLLVLVEADYAETFAAAATWTLPGATHGLDSAALIPMCWSDDAPRQWILPASLTVDATSFDVVVTWPFNVAGTLALVEAQYVEPFTNAASVTATGVEHTRATEELLTAVYDDASPAQWVQPGRLTVHQSSYNVVMTAEPALSGSLVVYGEEVVSGDGGAMAPGYQVVWRRRRTR